MLIVFGKDRTKGDPKKISAKNSGFVITFLLPYNKKWKYWFRAKFSKK